jgi:SOS-response transcriptional repressor LexA
VVKEEEWSHKKIILKPNSYDPDYQPIELNDDELSTLKVVGIFVAVL